MKIIHNLALTIAFTGFFTIVGHAAPKHGIAMFGEPALAPDFKNLPYANPDAPKGGVLKQAVVGIFDSINPFILKGDAAIGPRTFVFESLIADITQC